MRSVRRTTSRLTGLALTVAAAAWAGGCGSPATQSDEPSGGASDPAEVTADVTAEGTYDFTYAFAEAPRSRLDGEERSFLIVGYSTSYAWPDMLQEMLDEHAGRPGVYHVLNAVAGGAAVEIWIDEPGTEDYERTIGAMKRDFLGRDARLRGDAPEPEIALCQQSLQFTGDRRGPVKAEYDMVGAELGADAMEKLALRLRDLGVEEVLFGMHIYKHPVEPEVGNEAVALRRLLARGHDFVYAGPDVWTPTRDEYPDCFEDDGLHPNERGMKLMAEGWYRAVAGPDAREDVIERMYAREYDIRTMMRRYLAWRRGDPVD